MFNLQALNESASSDEIIAASLNGQIHSDIIIVLFTFFYFIPQSSLSSIAKGGVLHCAASNDDCNDALSIFDKKQHAPH